MEEIIKNKIYIIKNYLTDDECDNYISNINNLKTSDDRKFSSSCEFYNSCFKDYDIAAIFLKRLSILPIHLEISNVNPYIAYAYYKTNEVFGLHTDTGTIDHVKNLCTGFVLLIYLNDGFSGGQTLFYDDKFNHLVTVRPEKGMALIFDIDMLHEANKVDEGEKYWMGADLMIPFVYNIDRLKYV